jgi:hypothetical protein
MWQQIHYSQSTEYQENYINSTHHLYIGFIHNILYYRSTHFYSHSILY